MLYPIFKTYHNPNRPPTFNLWLNPFSSATGIGVTDPESITAANIGSIKIIGTQGRIRISKPAERGDAWVSLNIEGLAR